MDTQEIFNIIGIVALVLICFFIIGLIYVLYRINKLAKMGLDAVNTAARTVQESLGTVAKGWGKAAVFGAVFKFIKRIF